MKHRAEGRDEGLERVDDALGIRPADHDAMALRDGPQFDVSGAGGLVALLSEAGADHDRGAHALAPAFLERKRDVSRWHDNDGEVGRLRQFGNGRIASQAEHLWLAARHRIDAPGIAVCDQVMSRSAAQGMGIGRGADDRDAVRGKKGFQIRHRLSAARGRGR